MLYINGRYLTQQLTGVQRFASEITKELLHIADAMVVSPKLQTLIGAEVPKANLLQLNGFKGHLWDQVSLRKFLFQNKKPLLLSLANTGPLFYKNQIITIHDLGFLHANWHSKSFKAAYMAMIPILIKNSRHIITVSEFSRGEIIAKYCVKPSDISVVYNAPFTSVSNYDNTTIATVMPDRYILSVGSIDPRKNLKRLVKSFLRLKDENILLYLIGNYNKNFSKDAELDELLENNSSKIKLLGYVTDEMLVSYYKDAIAFVYPSLYEGFGLPPLEAMSYGCPVITSNVCSLPEVCGNAVVYCNPLSEDDIVEKISYVLSNSWMQKQMKQLGIVQSEKFNWKISANHMNDIVQKFA